MLSPIPSIALAFLYSSLPIQLGVGSTAGRIGQRAVGTESPERRWDARGSVFCASDNYILVTVNSIILHSLPSSRIIYISDTSSVSLTMVMILFIFLDFFV